MYYLELTERLNFKMMNSRNKLLLYLSKMFKNDIKDILSFENVNVYSKWIS